MNRTLYCLVGLLFALAACARSGPAPASTSPVAPTTNGFAPIAYYEESCSRCHGQFGAGYLPDMGKRLTDGALRKIIKDMADGPAGAPLDDAQLEAELAYHRSFIDGMPFIARVSATDAGQTGEVTSGSTLRVEVDGNVVKVAVEGQMWKLPVAVEASPRLIAERAGKRTTLQSGKPHSHITPR